MLCGAVRDPWTLSAFAVNSHAHTQMMGGCHGFGAVTRLGMHVNLIKHATYV